MKDLLHQFNVVSSSHRLRLHRRDRLPCRRRAHQQRPREAVAPPTRRTVVRRRPEMVSLEWHKFDAYDDGVRHQGWN
jgi:hypothetical protein